MEWQPIETAPTNKFILLGFFYEDIDRETLDGYENNEDADCFIQLGKVSRGYNNGIFARVFCGAPSNHYACIHLDVSPTHWMPLPPPPSE